MIEAKVNIKINQRIPLVIMSKLAAVINDSALAIEADAKQKSPMDMGGLRSSLVPTPATANRLFSKIDPLRFGSKMLYVSAMEFGAKWPMKMPPWKETNSALQRWVRRKGLAGSYSIKTGNRVKARTASGKISSISNASQDRTVAFLIARSFKKKGMKARPFLMPAYRKNLPWFIQNVARTLRGMDFNVNVSTRNM